MMVPSKKIFLIGLGVLAGILLVYGLLRWKFGPFLPPTIDKNLPDFIMFCAVGVMLWNRKIRSDEDKAAAEKKRIELEAEAARQAEVEGEAEGEGAAGEGAQAAVAQEAVAPETGAGDKAADAPR
jgi:hypothetical protein